MTVTRASEMTVETENGPEKAVEIVTETGNEEIAARTEAVERSMETGSWSGHQEVKMAVLMEVPRVGAEAEVETDTHDATVPMMEAAVMEISTEEMDAPALAPGAQTDTIVHEEIVAAIETRKTQISPEKSVGTEMKDDEQVEAQSEKLLLLWLRMSVIAALSSFNNLLLVLGLKNS
jgi:hypothetical protein